MDIRIVIRLIFSNVGLPQSNLFDSSKNPILSLSRRGITNEELLNIANDSKKAIDIGMKFLKKIGISSNKFLTHQTALVPIFKYIYLRKFNSVEEINNEDFKNMLIWLSIVSFRERFGSNADTKLQKDIKVIERHYSNGFPIKRLLKNLSSRRRATIGITKTELDEENAANKEKIQNASCNYTKQY